MNRLNGPFRCCRVGDEYRVEDKFRDHVATCPSLYLGGMISDVLNDAWKRQTAAIEVAERVERE